MSHTRPDVSTITQASSGKGARITQLEEDSFQRLKGAQLTSYITRTVDLLHSFVYVSTAVSTNMPQGNTFGAYSPIARCSISGSHPLSAKNLEPFELDNIFPSSTPLGSKRHPQTHEIAYYICFLVWESFHSSPISHKGYRRRSGVNFQISRSQAVATLISRDVLGVGPWLRMLSRHLG